MISKVKKVTGVNWVLPEDQALQGEEDKMGALEDSVTPVPRGKVSPVLLETVDPQVCQGQRASQGLQVPQDPLWLGQ